MNNGISGIQSDGKLAELTETAYYSESILQKLLATYLNFLGGKANQRRDPSTLAAGCSRDGNILRRGKWRLATNIIVQELQRGVECLNEHMDPVDGVVVEIK